MDCIKSIYEQTDELEFEIIVVDNASTDDSCDVIAKEYPEVVLVKSPDNLGFGRANNLGMEVARGEYIFLLNSDTILINNAVKLFYDYAVLHDVEKIGVLGTILLDSDHKPTHSYGNFITIANTLFKCIPLMNRFTEGRKTSCLADSQTLDVDYVTGADMFIPRVVLAEVGAFDPAFFMYCEEVDWQHRMSQQNFKRIIISGPQIIHLEGGSAKSTSRSWSYGRMMNIIRSRIIYIKKHNSMLAYIIFRIIYFPLRAISVFTSMTMTPGNKFRIIKLLIKKA